MLVKNSPIIILLLLATGCANNPQSVNSDDNYYREQSVIPTIYVEGAHPDEIRSIISHYGEFAASQPQTGILILTGYWKPSEPASGNDLKEGITKEYYQLADEGSGVTIRLTIDLNDEDVTAIFRRSLDSSLARLAENWTIAYNHPPSISIAASTTSDVMNKIVNTMQRNNWQLTEHGIDYLNFSKVPNTDMNNSCTKNCGEINSRLFLLTKKNTSEISVSISTRNALPPIGIRRSLLHELDEIAVTFTTKIVTGAPSDSEEVN